MMSSRSVVLIAPVRTAIGTFGGSLKDIPAPELGAIATAWSSYWYMDADIAHRGICQISELPDV